MTKRVIRPATLRDATDLAAMVDMAGEGLPTYFWSQMVEAGQSPIEIGRMRAMREEGAFSYRNAQIAEVVGRIAGGLVSYAIADASDASEIAEMHEIARPLALLEAEVPGYWYVNVLAVYPEFRGQGIGRELLSKADQLGREANSKGMAIIVASENVGALRLYERAEYRPVARRPLVGYRGFKRGGDWILLTKPHS